jgi:NAD(P)-dependent dehydrogenase (short-subunit alcohol dehydrogenase family)
MITTNAITKAAIRSFARSRTVDLKHRKIRVNAVSHGLIDTPMTRTPDESQKQLNKNFLNIIPLERMGTPDEIAKAVAFLASDDSSYIAGIELFVDGGVAQI